MTWWKARLDPDGLLHANLITCIQVSMKKKSGNKEVKKRCKRFIFFNYMKQILRGNIMGLEINQSKKQVPLVVLIITNKRNNESRLSRNTGGLKPGLVLPIKAVWSGTTFHHNKFSKSHRELNLDQFLKNDAIKSEVSKWYFIQTFESLKCQLRSLHSTVASDNVYWRFLSWKKHHCFISGSENLSSD